MNHHAWVEEFPAAVTVCDAEGIILALNQRSAQSFAAEGGRQLIGSNALDCHPEPARSKLAEMLASGQNNIYTVERNGVRKLVYQSPWYQDGQYAGFVELILEIPWQMPHFLRG
jgi:transcriptional regulator with PAS, ATPase and Fis domain